MKQVIIFILVVFSGMQMMGQDGGTTVGLIYTSGNESMEKTIYIPIQDSEEGIPDHMAIQRGVEYLGDDGQKKELTPWDLDRLEFNYRGKSYIYVSTNYDGKRSIMKVVMDGKLRMLEYRSTRTDDFNRVEEVISRVLSIEGSDQGKNTKIYVIGFKRAMKEFFSNYPEMYAKVKAKEFRYDNVYEMVNYFNQTYGNK